MMIHHGTQDYNTAVSEASKHFQKKIEDMIHTSVPRVQQVIEQVQNDVPEDIIVLGRTLRFNPQAASLQVVAGDQPPNIHEHAFQQVCDRPKIKTLPTVMRELKGKGEWGTALVAQNLNEIYS